METVSGTNILMVIPKNQFCEEEFFTIRQMLENAGARVVVLSKSGREAVGMKKERFQPDGMIVDWDKQEGITGKYDAVVVVGGRGAPKSLWDDPILPQILTDHYRAGRVVGAIGLGVVALARANLLFGETAAPEHESCLKMLEESGAALVDGPVTRSGRIVTGKDAETAVRFARTLLEALNNRND